MHKSIAPLTSLPAVDPNQLFIIAANLKISGMDDLENPKWMSENIKNTCALLKCNVKQASALIGRTVNFIGFCNDHRNNLIKEQCIEIGPTGAMAKISSSIFNVLAAAPFTMGPNGFDTNRAYADVIRAHKASTSPPSAS